MRTGSDGDVDEYVDANVYSVGYCDGYSDAFGYADVYAECDEYGYADEYGDSNKYVNSDQYNY